MSESSFLGIEGDVFSALCWKIGTPVAYRALKALERQDWMWLVSMKVQPADYVCAKTYLEDRQIACFFKKFKGFDLKIDLAQKAKEDFFRLEAQCYQSNERISPLLFDLGHYGGDVKRLIVGWRKEVRRVLGGAPRLIDLRGRFGPGTTFLNVGDDITVAHKLSDSYSRTPRTAQYLHLWDTTAWSRYAACSLDTIPSGFDTVGEHQGHVLYSTQDGCRYAIRDFEVVRGNRFTSVDKDATKKRGICIEPSLNVFLQLAVGEDISNRMKRKLGWDKRSAQDLHKLLARLGSLTGAVATIDLSSASDTVCSNLVKLLLPPAWFRLVDDLRSHFTLIEGKWVKLEKFSSMGNGFTFELETLLFWSLATALQELEPARECPYTPGLRTSVFGDDIILPTSVSKSYISALRFFGFTPNLDKTFTKGKFRESCGGDYHSGHDVRPHYQKEVCDEPHQLISLANGLRRFGHRHGHLGGAGAYRASWFKCLDGIPYGIRRLRGPEALGDLVIHDDESYWITANPWIERNCIRYLRVWRPVPNRVIGWDHWRPGVVLACALYGVSSGTPPLSENLNDGEEIFRRSGVIPRVNGSYVSGYRFGRVAYS